MTVVVRANAVSIDMIYLIYCRELANTTFTINSVVAAIADRNGIATDRCLE